MRQVFSLRDAFGRPNRLVRCARCSLVQAEVLPSADELGHYYRLYAYEEEASWNTSAATEQSLNSLAARLAPYRGAGRLLDVGCGAGLMLRAMRRQGWDVEGLELSPTAAEKLRAMGYVVHVGAITEVVLPPGGYDVVVMSEVLEHLLEPRRSLARIAGWLRPGGVVYITTPNFGSLSRRLLGPRWRPIYLPEHLYYFTPRSMERLLAAVGFAPLRIWTGGLNPFDTRPVSPAPPPSATSAAPPAPATSSGNDGRRVVEALRGWAVRCGPLGAAKRVVDGLLNAASAGDTLKVLARR